MQQTYDTHWAGPRRARPRGQPNVYRIVVACCKANVKEDVSKNKFNTNCRHLTVYNICGVPAILLDCIFIVFIFFSAKPPFIRSVRKL